MSMPHYAADAPANESSLIIASRRSYALRNFPTSSKLMRTEIISVSRSPQSALHGANSRASAAGLKDGNSSGPSHTESPHVGRSYICSTIASNHEMMCALLSNLSVTRPSELSEFDASLNNADLIESPMLAAPSDDR